MGLSPFSGFGDTVALARKMIPYHSLLRDLFPRIGDDSVEFGDTQLVSFAKVVKLARELTSDQTITWRLPVGPGYEFSGFEAVVLAAARWDKEGGSTWHLA